jgi:hypothetical protein
VLTGLAASAAIPAPELANALCGLAASAEPDRRDAELLSLYAAILDFAGPYRTLGTTAARHRPQRKVIVAPPHVPGIG